VYGWRSSLVVRSVAADLGLHHATLRKHVRQAETDGGLRPDMPTSAEREEIKKHRKEVFELRRAKRDPEGRKRVFAADARRRPNEVTEFIAEHRERFGVEPIRRTLGRVGVRILPLRAGRPVRAGDRR
jgi:transposase